MRKKQLKALTPPRPTEEMIRRAKEDSYAVRRFCSWCEVLSYETKLYYAAREQDGILVVSAWERKALAQGVEEPGFTIYIDPEKCEWITLAFEERWSKARIYTIAEWYGNEKTSRYAEDVDDPESLETCRRVLDIEEAEIKRAIWKWQNGIGERKNQKKAEKKKAHWDQRMSLIPPVPEGFMTWADKDGTRQDHFLFYKRKNRRSSTKIVYCTRCGHTSEGGFDMRHSGGRPEEWTFRSHAEYYNCPFCGHLLATKQWGRNNYLGTHSYVVLPQLVEGGEIVLRQFEVKKLFYREKDGLGLKDQWAYNVAVVERSRVFVNPTTFDSIESYAVRDTQRFGITWAASECHPGRVAVPESDFVGELYTLNAGEIGRASSLQEVVIKECASGEYGGSPQARLRRACRRRCTEYLIKSGLTAFARQILDGAWNGCMKADAKDLKTLLGLDGQQLRTMKDINGTMVTLENLHAIRDMNEKADLETIGYMEKEKIYITSLPIGRTGMNLQRTMNYLRKQSRGREFKKTLSLYKDYLDMAEGRGMDLRDEIVCRTPRLDELHDRYVEEAAARKATDRDLQVDRRFKRIREENAENKKHFEYSRQGFVIVVPERASDITREGREQHHCVGATDTYIDKMDRRKTFILFLRKEDNIQKPYYTLEVKYEGSIIQAYGAYDRQPDWEEVKAFLEAFTRQIKKRTQEETEKAAELICCAV